MKFLLLTVLCSVSLTQGMQKATPTPQEKVAQEISSLDRCLRNTKLTIVSIKKGTSDLPTLEEAQAAQARIENRLERMENISQWVATHNPSKTRFNVALTTYKIENNKQLLTIPKQPASVPTTEPTVKKKGGLTFSEYLAGLPQLALDRSISAPTTTQEQITALILLNGTTGKEDAEPINDTFGNLFNTKEA